MDSLSFNHSEADLENQFLSELLGKLWRRKWFIASGTLFFAGVLTFSLQVYPKTYQAVAVVQVQSEAPKVVSRDIINGEQAFTDETAGTELGIFKSRELQSAVITKLHLLAMPEFNPDLKLGWWGQSLAWLIRQPIASKLAPEWLDQIRSVIEPSSSEKMLFDTMQVFASKVKAEPVSHSKLIEITAKSRDRGLSAMIANTVANEYIATHERMKEEAYDTAHSFTGKRVPELRAAMERKVAAVEEFRQANDLVSGQYGAILRERLTGATKALIDARTHLGRLESSVAVAKSVDPLTVPEVMASATIQNLRLEESKVSEDGAYAGALFQNRWGSKRAAVQARINEEARRIINSLPKLVAAARVDVESQTKSVSALQHEVVVMEAAQSKLTSLENDATLATHQYNDFATRALQTNPDVAYTAVNVRLVSAAGVPYKAYFPNNTIAVPVIFVLAFLGMSGWALHRERRGFGFRSMAALRSAFNLDVIGRIPQAKRSQRAVYDNAIEELCARVCPPFEENVKKTILVTSVWPDEGKTTISLALAKAAAARDLSAVVVSADMRVQGLRKGVLGLSDILRGMAEVEDVIGHDSGVAIIPAGSPRGNPTSLLSRPTMPALMAHLQAQYDLVVVDAPPAELGGDAWTLSKLADEVLFVVKYGDTQIADITSAFQSIQADRRKIKVVLNMMPIGANAPDEIAYSPRMLKYYQPQKLLR